MTTSTVPTSGAGDGSAPRAAPRVRMLDQPLTEPGILFLIVTALMSIGVMMVYSASRPVVAAGDSYYVTRELIFVPTALVALVVGMFIPYRWLNHRLAAVGLLVLTIGLCASVMKLGEEINGARRWFSLPLGVMRISFQPSELAKFTMVIFMAWFFSRKASQPRSFVRGFLPAMGLIGLVVGLIAREDFGTGALVGLVSVGMCLIAGWRWWFPLLVIGPGLMGGYIAVMQKPFRLERLKVWLDPWQYYDGHGWHVCQSLMALGSGGFFGVGLGGGVQKSFIPENTTDFIFAVLCEEMGVLGGVLVIGLFGVFIWRAGRVVARAPYRFGFLLASGIMMTIGLQAVLNIGVVTSALPAKGISLPFISYGGSGLVMMGLAVGLLASVARAGVRAGKAAPAAAESQPSAVAQSVESSAAQPLVYRPASSGSAEAGPAEDAAAGQGSREPPAA
jgi:cell division protein FtsW